MDGNHHNEKFEEMATNLTPRYELMDAESLMEVAKQIVGTITLNLNDLKTEPNEVYADLVRVDAFRLGIIMDVYYNRLKEASE